MPSAELIDAVIEHVDRQLSAARLRTYSQLVDQLVALAAAAVRDNGKLEAEIRSLEQRLELTIRVMREHAWRSRHIKEALKEIESKFDSVPAGKET